MTLEEVQKLIQGIFDNIFNAVTQAEPGGKPVAQASTTMLSLMKPGLAINAKDFRNPWTPGNPGDADAQRRAINTAQLVDAAPKMSAIYTDSGNSITQIYKQMLDGVQIPEEPANPAIEKQLQDAEDYLFRLVDVPDPDTGAITKKKFESLVYRDYLDNQSAYNAARMAYIGAFLEAQKTAAGRNTWPLVATTLQIPVKQAFDRWRGEDASKVEQNLAIKSTSTQNALQLAWREAQTLYESYGVVLEDTGTGLSPHIQRSTLLPSDWYSSGHGASGWTVFDSATNTSTTSNTSDFTSFGGSAGFSLGLFSIGGSGGHSSEHRHVSSETNGMHVHFEYTLVTVRRPWMTFNLLGTKGWNLGNLYKKGTVSNGSKINQMDSAMPLLPTSFVVARNIKIGATWSKADADFIKTSLNAGGGFSIGPFSIGGSYAHSASNETFTSAFAGGEISVPGVQIIGWISQVVPFSPPN